MKRLLLGLVLLGASQVWAMEQQPEHLKLTKSQKERLTEALLKCDMDQQEKQAILNDIADNVAFTEHQKQLLEAYDLTKHITGRGFTPEDFISRFVNKRTFVIGLAKVFIDENDNVVEEPEQSGILKLAVKSLRITDLEVTIKNDDGTILHEGTLGEFFDQKKLKKAATTIIEDHAKEEADEDSSDDAEDRLADYHLRLKRSIKKERFKELLPAAKYDKLFIKVGRSRRVNIAFLLSLFGFIEPTFHDLDELNKVIDKVMVNEDVENHYILNCIDLGTVLRGLGYTKDEMPDLDGLRSLISQMIGMLTDVDGETFTAFLSREGNHWRATTKGGPKPQTQKDSDPVQNSNN